MHIQTHILSGWCVASLVQLSPRERVFCMLAASLPDVDGLGRLVSEEWYWNLHHKLGHCLLAGVIIAAALVTWSSHRLKMLALALSLFHLHLLMDYFGSGPGWPIDYLWPFSNWELENPHAWAFFSWQNLSAAGLLLIWTVWIAFRQHRTPLEVLYPSLDRRLIGSLPPPHRTGVSHSG